MIDKPTESIGHTLLGVQGLLSAQVFSRILLSERPISSAVHNAEAKVRLEAIDHRVRRSAPGTRCSFSLRKVAEAPVYHNGSLIARTGGSQAEISEPKGVIAGSTEPAVLKKILERGHKRMKELLDPSPPQSQWTQYDELVKYGWTRHESENRGLHDAFKHALGALDKDGSLPGAKEEQKTFSEVCWIHSQQSKDGVGFRNGDELVPYKAGTVAAWRFKALQSLSCTAHGSPIPGCVLSKGRHHRHHKVRVSRGDRQRQERQLEKEQL